MALLYIVHVLSESLENLALGCRKMRAIRVQYRKKLIVVGQDVGEYLPLPDYRHVAFRIYKVVLVWSIRVENRLILDEQRFDCATSEATVCIGNCSKCSGDGSFMLMLPISNQVIWVYIPGLVDNRMARWAEEYQILVRSSIRS